MIILAIDTSCDETSVAVVDGARILSNVISSQVRYHKKYGGVVPFMAQRLHKERIDAVVELAVQRAGLAWSAIEALAVTYGPGLAPALQVGIAKAKELAQEHSLPLYAVNHMAGHVASCFARVGTKARPEVALPALALLVSGGHTELVCFECFGSFEVVGQTLDDALGEAYDKVAKMLGLGYPGGRLISRLAEDGDDQAYPLPIPMQYSKDLNLSYSGLKNAVRLLIEELKAEEGSLTKKQIEDVSACFQRVAQESVMVKLGKALQQYPEVQSLLLAGGVAANTALRARVRVLARKAGLSFHVPSNLKLCTDNAAMIGVAASLGIDAGQQPVDPEGLDRVPGLTIEG